jgi:hypothetical protein
MARYIAISALLAAALVGSVQAGTNRGDARVAVHVVSHGPRSCSQGLPVDISGCEDIVTTEPGAEVDAFPVFFDLAEYQGCEYALCWPGLYSAVFTSCSDLTIGEITRNGDGISHAWYSCRSGPVCIPGWAWISDYGAVCVCPHPEGGAIAIGDCEGELDDVAAVTCAGIGGHAGDDPCGGEVKDQRTWGEIKDLFK